MAGTATNIIVGAAVVTINGTDVGYTQGGTSFRYEKEFVEIPADQAVGIVRRARSLERAYVTTTFLELTLANIRRALMLPSAHLSGSTLTLGYNNSCWTEEVEIVLTTAGINCGTRTFTFSRCISIGNIEYNMSREEASVMEVEFEILKNSSGNFGTIVDS